MSKFQFIQTGPTVNKYQVSIEFTMDDEFMTFVPSHRTYINYLIQKRVIDSYAVSLEAQKAWIILNAASRDEVIEILDKSPLRPYWIYTIDDIFIIDGQGYRLPAVLPN